MICLRFLSPACPRSCPPAHLLRPFSSLASGTPDVTVVKETNVPVAGEAAASRQLLFHRTLTHMEGINTKILQPRQTWVDNFENSDPSDKRGLIELHPRIFSTYPRVDLIQKCAQWQATYREVCVSIL